VELIPLPPNLVRVGQALPFALRDAEGNLMFAAGQVLENTPLLQALLERGAYVAAYETKEYRRALAHKMDTLMHQGAVLGDIVKVQAEFSAPKPVKALEVGLVEAWSDLQLNANAVLRNAGREDFLARFEALHEQVLTRLNAQPDATLMVLIHDAAHAIPSYSSRHALLCTALAALCAAKLGWDAAWSAALTRAALSMNLAHSVEQDRLTEQADAPSPVQRARIAGHGERSAELLQAQGVSDPLWLDAVRLHHAAGPGPLAAKTPAEQLARLLRRIDIFCARLSPRRSRQALSGAAAARGVYLDEMQQPDEAGAALIKAVGLYPPGTVVRLANDEVGIVVKRGHTASDPLVKSLLGKSGTPLSSPVTRDTRLKAQAVAASLAPHELKMHVSVDKLL